MNGVGCRGEEKGGSEVGEVVLEEVFEGEVAPRQERARRDTRRDVGSVARRGYRGGTRSGTGKVSEQALGELLAMVPDVVSEVTRWFQRA